MSGIAGIVHRDGRPVAAAEVEGMLNAMPWRGPDGRGGWHDGPVGLGHLLLSVTPESRHEQQPLVRGDLAVTADARLDNRAELLAALAPSGSRDTLTDPELILLAYRQWGDRCVEHLLGDFAFALWHARERTLFCARDHLGVRPFVYYCADHLFVFGSQPGAVLAAPGVPRELNEEFMGRFIAGRFDDPAITAYRRHFRLPAAHTLTVGPEGTRMRRFWSLDAEREIRLRSDAEYEEAFRETFFTAVQCRLRSDAPVGTTLSGGLDSSSIACAARRLLPPDRTLHTFSFVFPRHPGVDERQYIDTVLAQGEFMPHRVEGDAVSPFIDLEWQLAAQSEPSMAVNMFLHWAMYRAARDAGVRVFLDGFDGDSAVSHGAQRMNELLWRGRWFAFWQESRALGSRYGSQAWRGPLLAELRAAAPTPLYRAYRSVRRRPPIPALPMGLRSGLVAPADGAPALPRTATRSERRIHRDFVVQPLNALVLEIANRAAAAHGLESSHPFFDRRVVEFCVALPAEQKMRAGWTRSILRRSMEDILPPAVQWRVDKSNLGSILPDVLLRLEHDRVERSLRSETLDDLADRAALSAIWERYRREPLPHLSVLVWRWATLALWLEQETHGAHRTLPVLSAAE